MEKSIAIQGIEGSNHHKVVVDFIDKNALIAPCDTFNELVNRVVKGFSDFGIMAIENSLAGSILPNYNLISNHDLTITAEYYLDIKHNLAALKGQKIENIINVKSHRMAFLQCNTFFESHPHLKLIEDVDTALPAKIIADNNIVNTAAIVPDGTAEMFGLEVLQYSIQDNNINSTRFVKIERKDNTSSITDVNKASIKFELSHQPGSLLKVIEFLAKYDINLTKIQSVPTAHKKWNYAFYIDMVFDSDTDIYEVIKALDKITHQYKTLGIYKKIAND